MWYDNLEAGKSWSGLWSGYILCGCRGIRKPEGACERCGAVLPKDPWVTVRMADGREERVPHAYCGAEGRYEDYVYLKMIEREWKRSLTEEDEFKDVFEKHRPSARAAIAVIFWSYFETRIERLLRESMKCLPPAVADELLLRFGSIGSRLDRLYRILFSTTYWADLKDLRFEATANLLLRVQESRNGFAHGHPEAIDDALVNDLVEGLKDEHDSWIAAFNKRVPLKI